MSLREDLYKETLAIFRAQWTAPDAKVVPSDDSLGLGNDGRYLEAAVLYADLSASTDLVDTQPPQLAAEIYKAFLRNCARVIRSDGGTITAYDGDRVMAVFIGDTPRTVAAKVALKINFACKNIVQPAFNQIYKTNTYRLKHVVGIDYSKLLVARAGIRGANDLVWVGRAANYAAKLSAMPDAHSTWITKTVYDGMADSSKFSQPDNRNMWTADVWAAMGNQAVYKSDWTWSF